MSYINVLFFDGRQEDLDLFAREQRNYASQRGADSWRNIITAKTLGQLQADLQALEADIGFFDAFDGNTYNPEAVQAARWLKDQGKKSAFARVSLLYMLVHDLSTIPEEIQQARREGIISGLIAKHLPEGEDPVKRINDLINDVEFPYMQLR